MSFRLGVPNMKPEGMPIEFANAIALDPEKVNCFVKSRIDGLCFEIIGFLSKGVSQSHSTINQYATVTNLGSMLHTMVLHQLPSLALNQMKGMDGSEQLRIFEGLFR